VPIVKLNLQAFKALTQNLSNAEIARRMGINTVQLWRVRLPETDPRHNDPGVQFVGSVLQAFPGTTFEEVFFLAEPLRLRNARAITTGTEGRSK
jgi:hypothetical protein